MALRPRGVEDWFDAVPQLLSDAAWDVEVLGASASLAHCPCPWGGQLIRVIVSGITVQDPPENQSYVLLRPETRASFESGIEVLKHTAPGEATLKGPGAWGLDRLFSILFGTTEAASSYLVTHQRFRRDYPTQGDASLASFTDGAERREGFLMCTQSFVAQKFDLVGVCSMPEEEFGKWAKLHFQLLLDSAQRASHWYLNRPGLQELREVDREAYIVLTIQSCKRGLPLYPAAEGAEATVTIAAGAQLGLDRWVRFSPSQVGSEKFHLAEYIQVFLKSLGQEAGVYGQMDGRRLVPYQCVVKRDAWNSIRKLFVETFLLQKTAYRRANGGSTAPSLHEDVEPRFIMDRDASVPGTFQESRTATPRVFMVVRNTFVQVEVPSEEESEHLEVERRSSRRPKTTTILPVDIPVLAA